MKGMDRQVLQNKLRSISGNRWHYPSFEVHVDTGGALTIVDRSHTYTMASPRFTVSAETYDSIMRSESLDCDLYMMLTTEIGMDMRVALVASLQHE